MCLLGRRHGLDESLAAAQKMRIATPLGNVENIINLQAIDDEITIEITAEDFFRDLVATASTDDIDGRVPRTEEPPPGVDSANAPTGSVGMNHVSASQGIEHQLVGRQGFVGEALFSPDQCGWSDVQVTIGSKEIADFAIRYAESMLEFSGHGKDDRSDGIAGAADGIGGLFGMSTLAILVTAGAIACLDIELGDAGHDGREIGLKLGHRAAVIKRRRTIGAAIERHVNDAIGLRRGPEGWQMAWL